MWTNGEKPLSQEEKWINPCFMLKEAWVTMREVWEGDAAVSVFVKTVRWAVMGRYRGRQALLGAQKGSALCWLRAWSDAEDTFCYWLIGFSWPPSNKDVFWVRLCRPQLLGGVGGVEYWDLGLFKLACERHLGEFAEECCRGPERRAGRLQGFPVHLTDQGA